MQVNWEMAMKKKLGKARLVSTNWVGEGKSNADDDDDDGGGIITMNGNT